MTNLGVFSFIAKQSTINLLYTVLLFLNYYAYGLIVNLMGPVLVDLSYVYSWPLAYTANTIVASSAGYMAGTLFGWTFKVLNRQLVYSGFSLLLAVCNAFLPLYNQTWFVFLGVTTCGLGMGVIEGSTNIWLINMWPHEGTEAILQTSQLAYGLGTISAPLLASPFIFGDANFTSTGEALTVELRKSRLLIPFVISGAIQAVAPIVLLALFFIKRYRPQVDSPSAPTLDSLKPEKSNDSPINTQIEASSSTQTQISFRKVKLALSCALFAAYFTAENGYFPYAVTMWQKMKIGLSAGESAKVMSVLSGAFTVGPIVTALLSLKLPINTIISAHFGLVSIGLTALYAGQMSRTVIYGGSAILGYGMSAMVPGIQAFSNRHFRMSNRVAAVFAFVSGTISLVIPLIIGPYLESAPLMLLYLAGSFVALALALYILIKIWIFFSK